MFHNVRVYLMLCSEHYGRLYRKTIVERNNMGVRLQGVEPDIRLL